MTALNQMQPVEVEMLGSGGKGGNRTHDTRIFSPLLYQLSYLATSDASFRPADLAPVRAGLRRRAAADGLPLPNERA